ncbi:MAG: T9SS type A sorting domain-containing protein, partial [Bacteroidota bacterium]
AIFPILADDNGGTGDDDIYTITFEAAEGEHEYKYFLVEDEPSWDLGEWEGDPNRTLMVEEEMVVDNVWADLVSSIDDIDEDQLLSVYPNPVSSQLYVSSNSEITDITVYDITGRMLIQQTEDVIDVSGLRTGVYIIQVNTTEGTEARRFNVAR